jgi:hypothetical protein
VGTSQPQPKPKPPNPAKNEQQQQQLQLQLPPQEPPCQLRNRGTLEAAAYEPTPPRKNGIRVRSELNILSCPSRSTQACVTQLLPKGFEQISGMSPVHV